MNPEDQSELHEMDKQKINQEAKNEKPNKELSKTPGFFQLLSRLTTLSWNLAIPIIGGTLLGRYLDDLMGTDYKWTLSLLVLGVLVAFSNLYNLYVEQGGKKHLREKEQDDTNGMKDEKHQ